MGDVIKKILARPIQLAEQVIKVAEEATLFKHECMELKSKTSKLYDLLCQATRTNSNLYKQPTRRIIDDMERVLEKALSLAQKCRAKGLLKHVFALAIISPTSFSMMFSRMENSLGDISWLLRVSGCVGDEGVVGGCLGLPPIAGSDPILCLIWEQIAIVSMGLVDDRADAAASLVSLARDNDRYAKLILREGGFGPLLNLLKKGKTVEGRENAAQAIGLLGRDPKSVEFMVHAGVCSVFSKALKNGPMKVQATVAWAVSELARHYPKCQDIFAQHNVIRLLVGHLAFETAEEHSLYTVATYCRPTKDDEQLRVVHPTGKRSLSLNCRLPNVEDSVQVHAMPKPDINGNGNGDVNGNGNEKLGSSHHRSLVGSKARERELEDPQVKANMKAMSAKALWYLARGNSAICRSICESRALMCFAVLLEKGPDEVRHNSAMALLEITGVAERDSELRRSNFKPNSPASKALVGQLVKIIEKADSELLVPCVKTIGNLARTFKATDTRIIGPLVQLLDENETEVSRETAIALTKFAGIDNYLRVDHSKAIIASDGIKHLLQLMYFEEQRVQIPALVLLSYIALNVPESEALAQREVLTVLEWASKQPHLVQDEDRNNLLLETKKRMELFQSQFSR